MMTSQIVTYQVDESTTARFEIEPSDEFMPAGPDEIAGQVTRAVAPVIDAAKVVLEKLKEVRPDDIELKFGIKVSGGANWLVAKASGEANFEVSLKWSHDARQTEGGDK